MWSWWCPCSARPSKCREQAVVLGDVVGGNAETAVDLVNDGAVRVLDLHTEARGTRIAAGATIDMSSNHETWDCDAGAGTK